MGHMLADLPSELLVHIVRLADLSWQELSALSHVSIAFYRVCTEPELRRRALRGHAVCIPSAQEASTAAPAQRPCVLALERHADGGEEATRLTVAAVACGHHHCLVVTGSGEVYALGDYDDDTDASVAQTQTQTRPPPLSSQLSRVVLSPGVRITTVSAGFNHIMALRDNGRLYAWGRNDNGQLGVGRWSDQLPHWRTPLQVTIDAVVSIAAGKLFSLAVTRDGVLFEWGKTPHATRSRLPRRSRIGPAGKCTAAAAAGRQHIVVLASDGRVLWSDQHKLSEWNAGDSAAVAIGAGDNFGVFLTSKGDAMLMQRDAVHKLHDARVLGERAVEIAAGGDRALFRTDRGRLFSVHYGPTTSITATATATDSLPAPFTLRLDTETLDGLPSESLRGMSVGPMGCYFIF